MHAYARLHAYIYNITCLDACIRTSTCMHINITCPDACICTYGACLGDSCMCTYLGCVHILRVHTRKSACTDTFLNEACVSNICHTSSHVDTHIAFTYINRVSLHMHRFNHVYQIQINNEFKYIDYQTYPLRLYM